MSNQLLLENEGIDLKKHATGSLKTTCPKCTESRRHKKDLSLSVDIENGLWNCHHCGWKGRVFEKKVKQYIRPTPRRERVSDSTLEYFTKHRGISAQTLQQLAVTEAMEWMPQTEKDVNCICFNYYRGDDLINIKFRGPKKSFKLSKDAELVFFNLNALHEQDECIIVEGEIDCLSLHEAGILNSVSVPNGASKGVQKLEYLDNCWEYFKNMKRVVLMVDNDDAGYSLREELARRIGKEVCYRVIMPEGCKDANEVLIKYGKEALTEIVASAVQWPIEGVFTMEDMVEDVFNLYENGYPKGFDIGMPNFDSLCKFMPGEMTIVTGIPGSGKSEFVDLIMCSLAKLHNWSWGMCSFENQPSYVHVTKLMEKITGKSFSIRDNNPLNRMDIHERDYGIFVVDKYFHFINLSEVDVTLPGLLEKARELVVRKGIKGLLIDPWNYIEHKVPKNQTETQYISESLTMIKAFCQKYGVHTFVIAHPTKIMKDKGTGKYDVPTLYNISGSAHFFNKTDNGIVVYRDYEEKTVNVFIQKVRSSWLGQLGMCSFTYNTSTRQYKALIDPANNEIDDYTPLLD